MMMFLKYLNTCYIGQKKNNILAALVYKEHLEYLKRVKMKPCDAMKYSILLQEHGILSPCIEMPGIEISLSQWEIQRKKFNTLIIECNACTPCFYNDAREIGILWRNKWSILLNSRKIHQQLSNYGIFF